MASILLGCALFTSDPWLAAGFTALSCFAMQSTQSLWWSCAIGVSGKHVGALSSQFLVGAIADWMGAKG